MQINTLARAWFARAFAQRSGVRIVGDLTPAVY